MEFIKIGLKASNVARPTLTTSIVSSIILSNCPMRTLSMWGMSVDLRGVARDGTKAPEVAKLGNTAVGYFGKAAEEGTKMSKYTGLEGRAISAPI